MRECTKYMQTPAMWKNKFTVPFFLMCPYRENDGSAFAPPPFSLFGRVRICRLWQGRTTARLFALPPFSLLKKNCRTTLPRNESARLKIDVKYLIRIDIRSKKCEIQPNIRSEKCKISLHIRSKKCKVWSMNTFRRQKSVPESVTHHKEQKPVKCFGCNPRRNLL